MTSTQALKLLTRAGWRVARRAKGDHLILKRGDRETFVLTCGKQEMAATRVIHARCKPSKG